MGTSQHQPIGGNSSASIGSLNLPYQTNSVPTSHYNTPTSDSHTGELLETQIILKKPLTNSYILIY